MLVSNPHPVATSIRDISSCAFEADVLAAVDRLWPRGHGADLLRRHLTLLLLASGPQGQGSVVSVARVADLLRGRQRACGVDESDLCTIKTLQDALDQPDMRRCVRRLQSITTTTTVTTNTGEAASYDAEGGSAGSVGLSLDVAGLLELAEFGQTQQQQQQQQQQPTAAEVNPVVHSRPPPSVAASTDGNNNTHLPQFLFDYELATAGETMGPASAPGPDAAWRALRRDKRDVPPASLTPNSLPQLHRHLFSWKDHRRPRGPDPRACAEEEEGLADRIVATGGAGGGITDPFSGRTSNGGTDPFFIKTSNGGGGGGGDGRLMAPPPPPPPPPPPRVTRHGWPAHIDANHGAGGDGWPPAGPTSANMWPNGRDAGGAAWAPVDAKNDGDDHRQPPHPHLGQQQQQQQQLPGGALRSMLQGVNVTQGRQALQQQQHMQQQQQHAERQQQAGEDDAAAAFAHRPSASQGLDAKREAGRSGPASTVWSQLQQLAGSSWGNNGSNGAPHATTTTHGNFGGTLDGTVGLPMCGTALGGSRSLGLITHWDHERQYNGPGGSSTILVPPAAAAAPASASVVPSPRQHQEQQQQQQQLAHLHESASWPCSLTHLPQLDGGGGTSRLEGHLQLWYDAVRSCSDPVDLPAAAGWARQLAMGEVAGNVKDEGPQGFLGGSPFSAMSYQPPEVARAGADEADQLDSLLEAIIAFDSAPSAPPDGQTKEWHAPPAFFSPQPMASSAASAALSLGSRRASEADAVLQSRLNWELQQQSRLPQQQQQPQQRTSRMSTGSSGGSSYWRHGPHSSTNGGGLEGAHPRGSSTDGSEYLSLHAAAAAAAAASAATAVNRSSNSTDADAAAALLRLRLASLSHMHFASAVGSNGSDSGTAAAAAAWPGASGLRHGQGHALPASTTSSSSSVPKGGMMQSLGHSVAAAAGYGPSRSLTSVGGEGATTSVLRVGSAPGPSIATGRAISQRLPPRLTRRLEELVGRCRHIEWRHFDPGVIKVLAQLCESGEEDVFEELDLLEATDLSGVEYMPAYLNKRLNNKLWSRRKAAAAAGGGAGGEFGGSYGQRHAAAVLYDAYAHGLVQR